jgi:hypothetical protein
MFWNKEVITPKVTRRWVVPAEKNDLILRYIHRLDGTYNLEKYWNVWKAIRDAIPELPIGVELNFNVNYKDQTITIIEEN